MVITDSMRMVTIKGINVMDRLKQQQKYNNQVAHNGNNNVNNMHILLH